VLLDAGAHHAPERDVRVDLVDVGDGGHVAQELLVLRLGGDDGEDAALVVHRQRQEVVGLGEPDRDAVEQLAGDLRPGELLRRHVAGLQLRGEEAQQRGLPEQPHLDQRVAEAVPGQALLLQRLFHGLARHQTSGDEAISELRAHH
jgi:hypothetical protein